MRNRLIEKGMKKKKYAGQKQKVEKDDFVIQIWGPSQSGHGKAFKVDETIYSAENIKDIHTYRNKLGSQVLKRKTHLQSFLHR